jgi:glycosyltransferase involved in cell wall biosynthesis
MDSSEEIKNYLGKLSVIRDLIAKEEKNANLVAEAAYRIRFVRIAGIDVFDDLLKACILLKKSKMLHSFFFVAELILTKAFDSSDYSIKVVEELKTNIEVKQESLIYQNIIIDSRVANSPYQLSCIVSIYNEGNKAITCLEKLTEQTLYKEGKLEIIFVDSNSPAGEEDMFLEQKKDTQHFVYIKTSDTERLSSAWNRGVKMSSAKYLTFTAPSNFFVTDAFELLLNPFFKDEALVLTQGDIGAIKGTYDRSQELLKKDLKRITERKNSEIEQIIPFFFINYLAFDCCVIKKEVFDEINGFDQNYLGAAENHLHLNILTKGKIMQIGEIVEGTFEKEDIGPRLTVHPRIEIEHFQVIYEAFNCQNLLSAALNSKQLNNLSKKQILEKLISTSLNFMIPYPEKLKFQYYDFDKACLISRYSLSCFFNEPEVWNDYSILNLRKTVNRSLLYVDFSHSLPYNGRAGFRFNLFILRFVRWVLGFAKLHSHKKHLTEIATVGLANKKIGKYIRKISRVFIRKKTMQPDLFSDVIW